MEENAWGTKFWREKYKVSYCNHCESSIIICPKCKNTSCNAGGCAECSADFDDFLKLKTHPVFFLTQEEINTYNKIARLRTIIHTCVENGKEPIDWKWLDESGHGCLADKELFKEDISRANADS